MSSNDPAVAARSQASFALALLPAAIAHAALILAFANVIEAEIGTGGSVVEAIGVTLAESTVLASREAAPVAKVALSAPEAPAPPPSEVAAAARPADPPSPDLAPVLATHEPALTEIAVAPRPEPRPREIEIPREPVNTSAAAEPTPAEATAMAAAVSIVAEPVSIPVKSAAAASPGEMAAYQRSIVLALSESAPKSAGGAGTVTVRIVVGENGAVDKAEVVETSGNKRHERATLEAIARARLPVPPPGMTRAQRTFDMPYTFR